jgi:hypothetical protein
LAVGRAGEGRDPIPPASTLSIAALFVPHPPGAVAEPVLTTAYFCRSRMALPRVGEILLDEYPDAPGAGCCFIRLAQGEARRLRFVVDGVDDVRNCAGGGWLLRASRGAAESPVYWIPQLPALRTLDVHGRILSQRTAVPAGFGSADGGAWIELDIAADANVDVAVWRFPDSHAAVGALEAPWALAQQRWFLRSSHTTVRQVADVYQCLVHGWVYDNRFVWRRIWGGFRWRICSENEAHSLYMMLNGLERAGGGPLYTLLKRQIVGSLISRQAADGGWHHGEWTDLMESHFRLHSAGMLVLEAEFEESGDPAVAGALERAAAFLAARTDHTDVGLWFLHDALEESVERATAADAPPWTPTRMLGASASNKLILNTHLDSIVALDRYRELTGDATHAAAVDSARAATRELMAMRPAEWLYRPLYRAVQLTLLPADAAGRLSLPSRAVRRLARQHLLPRLYRVKQRFPRFVMPGGLIDRHLSPRHFDMGYHPVNLMDIVRLSRRFPLDDYREVVPGAVEAVTGSGLLAYWRESKHLQPIGYWVEALYHLCTLDPALALRAQLAEAMLAAEDAGIGVPPALLGADPEAVRPEYQVRCPSPSDPRLRVANLSCAGRCELLVVNPTQEALTLAWAGERPDGLRWKLTSGVPEGTADGPLTVPPRGGVLGRDVRWPVATHGPQP